MKIETKLVELINGERIELVERKIYLVFNE